MERKPTQKGTEELDAEENGTEEKIRTRRGGNRRIRENGNLRGIKNEKDEDS
ncbi:Uncharacterised protein [uncultured Clostridium sp.]|nr:Uncharacterised protein [uncultured Clostridium sp.]